MDSFHKSDISLFKVLLFFIFLIGMADLASSEETYRFERLWPTLQQPWYFNIPMEIAVDDGGNFYVADLDNHRIQKFTSDGAFIRKWGTFGTGDGQFDGSTQIAVDGSGYVYVTDTGNTMIDFDLP